MKKINLPLELASHLVFIKDQIELCEGCVIDRDENDNPICIRDYVILDTAKEWLDMFIKLEQDLGCPLEVVFKALKDNEIYLTHNDEIILDDSPALCFSYEGWYLYTCSGFIEYLKDYGKTWWLNRDRSE